MVDARNRRTASRYAVDPSSVLCPTPGTTSTRTCPGVNAAARASERAREMISSSPAITISTGASTSLARVAEFVAITEQQSHWQPSEVFARHVDEAVVRRHQHQPLDRPLARKVHRDSAAQTAPHDRNLGTFLAHVIEDRQGIRSQARLGGPSATAAIAAIVDEKKRAVRKCFGEEVDISRHILRVAAEVEERPRPRTRHDPDLDPLALAVDPDRLRVRVLRLRSRKDRSGRAGSHRRMPTTPGRRPRQ